MNRMSQAIMEMKLKKGTRLKLMQLRATDDCLIVRLFKRPFSHVHGKHRKEIRLECCLGRRMVLEQEFKDKSPRHPS